MSRGNAVEDFGKYLELAGADADIYSIRASCLYQLNDYTGAINDYTSSITIAPEDPETYYDRAYAYIEVENFESAINDYLKVLELDPENSRIPAKIATGQVWEK
jgi:tetratricopeptide (TPR) repeat protein